MKTAIKATSFAALVLFLAKHDALAVPAQGQTSPVRAQAGDPAWKRPYHPTKLEWFVLQLNIHSRDMCDREALHVTFGEKPNSAMWIHVNGRNTTLRDDQRECIARLLASVQDSASLGFGLTPPPVSLVLTTGEFPGGGSSEIFYECLLPKLAAGVRGWEESGRSAVEGLPLPQVCRERARVPEVAHGQGQ